MKELLRKECTLTALPMTYLFLLFALMTLVPGYPIAVGGFFFCLGLFQSTLSAREQHDLLFTLLDEQKNSLQTLSFEELADSVRGGQFFKLRQIE